MIRKEVGFLGCGFNKAKYAGNMKYSITYYSTEFCEALSKQVVSTVMVGKDSTSFNYTT